MVITTTFLGKGALTHLKLAISIKKDQMEGLLLFPRIQPRVSQNLCPHTRVTLAPTRIHSLDVWLIAYICQQTRQ